MKKILGVLALICLSLSIATSAMAGNEKPSKGNSPTIVDTSDDHSTPIPGNCWETGVDVEVDYKVQERTRKSGLTILTFLVKVTRWIPGVNAPEITLTRSTVEYPTYAVGGDGEFDNSSTLYKHSKDYEELECEWDGPGRG